MAPSGTASIPVLIIAMTLAYFTNYVRLVRSGVLNLVDQEYVEAARAGGSSSARIIISHIIPNTLGIILVNVTLNVSSLVIYQSTLSFIGLSLPAPAPEWGSMLSSARVDKCSDRNSRCVCLFTRSRRTSYGTL